MLGLKEKLLHVITSKRFTTIGTLSLTSLDTNIKTLLTKCMHAPQ
jgi:hypothetical protein